MHHNTEVAWKANGTYSPQLIGEKAVEIITNHNQAKPLFLYLPFQSVHAPLQVPRHYRNMQTKEVNNVRRKFLGMITAMDDAIGNVTQALKNANMLQNTIIIFLSDNGATPVYGGSNHPLRGNKFRVFEGGTRTVAFINAQGLVQRTEQRMMHVVDWYPTIMCGIYICISHRILIKLFSTCKRQMRNFHNTGWMDWTCGIPSKLEKEDGREMRSSITLGGKLLLLKTQKVPCHLKPPSE